MLLNLCIFQCDQLFGFIGQMAADTTLEPELFTPKWSATWLVVWGVP